MKYDIKDLKKVALGKANIEEMCEKYDTTRVAFIMAMNRQGYYLKKTKLKIISPHRTKVVSGINECAYELKVSSQTIRNYLNGKRVKTFEDLGIKIEIYKEAL